MDRNPGPQQSPQLEAFGTRVPGLGRGRVLPSPVQPGHTQSQCPQRVKLDMLWEDPTRSLWSPLLAQVLAHLGTVSTSPQPDQLLLHWPGLLYSGGCGTEVGAAVIKGLRAVHLPITWSMKLAYRSMTLLWEEQMRVSAVVGHSPLQPHQPHRLLPIPRSSPMPRRPHPIPKCPPLLQTSPHPQVPLPPQSSPHLQVFLTQLLILAPQLQVLLLCCLQLHRRRNIASRPAGPHREPRSGV